MEKNSGGIFVNEWEVAMYKSTDDTIWHKAQQFSDSALFTKE